MVALEAHGSSVPAIASGWQTNKIPLRSWGNRDYIVSGNLQNKLLISPFDEENIDIDFVTVLGKGKPLVICNFKVQLKRYMRGIPLTAVVVPDRGENLIGRNWLPELELDMD